jgi:hypothetical protein
MQSRLSILTHVWRFLSRIFNFSQPVVLMLDPVSPTADPGERDEPYAGVREPKRRSPSGKSSAVALKELGE